MTIIPRKQNFLKIFAAYPYFQPESVLSNSISASYWTTLFNHQPYISYEWDEPEKRKKALCCHPFTQLKQKTKNFLDLRNISRIFLLRSWEAMVGNRRRLSCGTNTKDYRDVVETL